MYLHYPGSGSGINTIVRSMRWDIELIGPIDGVNKIFTVPDIFVDIGNAKIRVYLSGQRILQGVDNDYLISESGGPGTGYDTVTLLGPAPVPGDKITADYLVLVG